MIVKAWSIGVTEVNFQIATIALAAAQVSLFAL